MHPKPLALAAIPLLASPLLAATPATWDGSTANWSDPSHWSTNPLYPDNNTGTPYDASINTGSLTLDLSPSLQKLSLGTATLSGPGSLTTHDLFTWTPSSSTTSVLSTASLLATNGIDFHGAGRGILRNTILTNSSSSAATLGVSGGSGVFTINLQSDATFLNAGTLTVAAGAVNSLGASTGTALFSNTGTLILNSSLSVTQYLGAAAVPLAFSNAGSILINSSTLTLTAATTSISGSISLLANTGLYISGPADISPSSSITGLGTFTYSGSSRTLTLNGNYNVAHTYISFAHSPILFAGPNQSTSTITSKGGFQIAPNAHLTADTLSNFGPIRVDGTLSLRPHGSLTTTSSIIPFTLAGTPNAWTGTLDLADNALIVNGRSDFSGSLTTSKAPLLAALANQIAFAKNGGAWNNPGITSSSIGTNPNLTIALADNADLNLTTFAGKSVGTSNVFLALAPIADANLDQNVDLADYDLWFKNVGSPGNATSRGDFNLDNQIDLADYDAWYSHVGATFSLTPDPLPQTPSSVPEPASLALLLPGILMFLGIHDQPVRIRKNHPPS